MRNLLLSLLILLVGAHILLVVANVASFFTLPFLAPWYIAVPVESFLINLMFNRKWVCPLTDLENHLRGKLGYRKIGGFIGHYFKKPVCIALGIKRPPKMIADLGENDKGVDE